MNKKTTLAVAGMDCPEEVKLIKQALKLVVEDKAINANLMRGTVTIEHLDSISEVLLINMIDSTGLKASPVSKSEKANISDVAKQQKARLIAVAISGVFVAAGLLLEWIKSDYSTFNPYIFAVAIITGAWFILPKAFRSLKQFSLDMNVLMTVAVIGSIAIREWSEGAVVTFLFSFSELLEAFSINRARQAIQSLLLLTPDTALVKQGDSIREIPVEEVKVDDIVVVQSGAKIPVDGEVVSGNSAVNQAPITGESIPVEKNPGDRVFSGTINGNGSLEVRVNKVYSETTLSKIIHLVEESQAQKAPSEKFVEVFARYYTPIVFILAILILLIGGFFEGSWSDWIYRSLVLIVIACPCALVISTPISIVSGLTAMAKQGVLLKGGAVLELVGKLKMLAVDKTGTITEGKPKVVEVKTWGQNSIDNIVRIASAIDVHSQHPLSEAVIRYANEQGLSFPRGENYQAHVGRGAEARVEGHDYFVANHRFAHELGLCSPELEAVLTEIEMQAQSVVVVGHKTHDGHTGEIMGIISIADTVRKDAAATVTALHKAGINQIVMLSGDNQRIVDAISKQVGIDLAYGDLLPDDKIEKIKELIKQYKYVGMVGDGVNDAPALALATVGIAMGEIGTDTAIEVADMVLMKDNLIQLPEAIKLGRRTLAVIKTNIAFALIVKAVFLTLALLGNTSLWLAILADTGATLIVIANALRLLNKSNNFKEKF